MLETASSWLNDVLFVVRGLPSVRKLDDDRISECTMDILNEATFNTQAFSAYDVNDDVIADLNNQSYNSSIHHRRGSVGSSSVHSESTQGKLSFLNCAHVYILKARLDCSHMYVLMNYNYWWKIILCDCMTLFIPLIIKLEQILFFSIQDLVN